jgi:hypothetical protein
MQALVHLPYSLAIAVLSTSRRDLHHQVSVLPPSLYPRAIDGFIPCIRREHSLSLSFLPLTGKDPIMAAAVLQAATVDKIFDHRCCKRFITSLALKDACEIES